MHHASVQEIDMNSAVEIAHANTHGRIRLRCKKLRGNARLAETLQRHLETDPRIKRVHARASTGSIILETPPDMSPEVLAGAVRKALGEIFAGGATPVSARPPRPEANGHVADRRKPDTPAWHAMSAADVAEYFQTDPVEGLGIAEAADRLVKHGPNRMPTEERRSQFSLLAEQFKSLPVGMLTASAAISLATGGLADAIATMAVVGVNAVFGYITEGQAESAIHALIDTSSQNVHVLRDGIETVVKGADLVPGDILLPRPGTQIPADARLTEAIRLSVDESALTGETLPVEKHPDLAAEPLAPLGAPPIDAACRHDHCGRQRPGHCRGHRPRNRHSAHCPAQPVHGTTARTRRNRA